MNLTYHIPVLLEESVRALLIVSHSKQNFVDATFGGGGHSSKILEKIFSKSILYAFDQDKDAWANAQKLSETYPNNFVLIKNNFRLLANLLKEQGVEQVNGILADLGVSSYQFDTADRGFSFRFDAELDMRMNQQQSKDAKMIVNEYTEKELHKIFGMYGEIKNARTLAITLSNARKKKTIKTINDFRVAIESCIPKKETNKYLAQTFQALRIEVNDEMKALEEMLLQTPQMLCKGARLVVISYHSLEDRLVKNFLQKGKFYGEVEKDFFGNEIKPFKIIEKMVLPTEEEIAKNPRARSAKMRVAEKI